MLFHRLLAREHRMPKRTLTDRLINSLKPAKLGTRYDAVDAVVPGLCVTVTDRGHKSFALIARFPGSANPTRRKLGDYGAIPLAAARNKARQWLELIARGVDPRAHEERQRAEELRQRKNTFATVAEDFIRDKLPSERKGREVERDIRREFLPQWGKLPVSQITDGHIRDVVKAAKNRGAPYQAHNLFTTARRLFSWAIDQRAYGLESSPCDRLRPQAIIGRKKPRTRIMANEEWRALWEATGALGYPYGPLFRMLALTGQRKSEVAEARWREFDIGHKLWTIPAERMKADTGHEVPLSDDVIEVLESLPRFNKGDYLFSTNFGAKPVNGFSKGKARLDKTMAAELGGAIEPFVIHDIRRSMRTGLSALLVPDLVRELVIAHAKPGLHKVYDLHAYQREKRHALELWSARLRSIVASAETQ
jgi:integrase